MNNLGNILKERNELVEAEQLLSKAVSIQCVQPKLLLLRLVYSLLTPVCFLPLQTRLCGGVDESGHRPKQPAGV